MSPLGLAKDWGARAASQGGLSETLPQAFLKVRAQRQRQNEGF